MSYVDVEYGSGGEKQMLNFQVKGSWDSSWASKIFTVLENGILHMSCCGYVSTAPVLKINGTTITPSFEFSQTERYIFLRYYEVEVQAGDTIQISTSSTGQSAINYFGVVN